MSEDKETAEATETALPRLECFEVERRGEVIVLRSKEAKILNSDWIEEAKEEMLQLAGEKVVIDFCTVEFMPSLFLMRLRTMDKKVKMLGGKLVVCSIRPAIYEVFAITRLDRLFCIKPDLALALAEFSNQT